MNKSILQFFLLLFLFVLFSCKENKNPCNLSEVTLRDLNSLDSLINIPKIRQRDSTWNYNNYKEPSLMNAQNETYRFIWNSSFDGTEIYKIEQINQTYKATIKTFAQDDTLGNFKEVFIASKKWKFITDSLSLNGFWTYPTSIDRKGLDGAAWILEAYKPNRDKCTKRNYHRIGRWSPIDTKFIAFCYLLKTIATK